MKNIAGILVVGFILFGGYLFFGSASESFAMKQGSDITSERPEGYPSAILAGGCFWCMESEYRALDGVLYTRAGYAGGHVENPTYRAVTSGKTGHAEIIEVVFDPDKVDYAMLVEFFLTKAHDPTQLNRQGVDVGTQYRSAIFPVDEAQETIARAAIERVEMNKIYDKPIVTTIEPLTEIWVAEDYHQQYYEKYEEANGAPHIRVVMKKGKKR